MQNTTDQVGELLRGFVRHVARRGLDPEEAPHEHAGIRVSTSEVFALEELSAGGGALSQQDLGAAMGLEKSTVSRLAAGMEERGWLTRERDPGNRRLYRLALTAEGRDVARRVLDDVRSHHDALLARLTPGEREALATGLRALLRTLADHPSHPSYPSPHPHPHP